MESFTIALLLLLSTSTLTTSYEVCYEINVIIAYCKDGTYCCHENKCCTKGLGSWSIFGIILGVILLLGLLKKCWSTCTQEKQEVQVPAETIIIQPVTIPVIQYAYPVVTSNFQYGQPPPEYLPPSVHVTLDCSTVSFNTEACPKKQ